MATYYNENTVIYSDGRLVKAAAATMDLYSQSLHYGYAVFEGIRSYRTENGEPKIFKAVEHYERLRNSALAMAMPYHWSSQELIDVTYELLRLNNLDDAYIRPVVYAPANMSFAKNSISHIVIEVWQMAPFLGEKLLRIMTSSFERPNPRAFKIHAKAAGHYVNSLLASHEAKANGFDEALLNDMNGYVAEGTGANVFCERNGEVYTPPPTHILPGITRATVFELCKSLGIPLKEVYFTIDDLKQADAAFFCGTAAEIVGWESLDTVRFPKRWEDSLGRIIQKAYQQLIREKAFKPSLETA